VTTVDSVEVSLISHYLPLKATISQEAIPHFRRRGLAGEIDMPLPFRLSDGRLPGRLVLLAPALTILIAFFPPLCQSQSLDKNDPTPLRAREINGRADFPVPSAGWGRTFYYVFTAKAGRWSAKVTTNDLKKSKSGVRYNVSFDRFPLPRRQRRRFPSLEVLDPLAWRRREVSIRFSLARQTRLLMIVNLSGEFDYQITLDGP